MAERIHPTSLKPLLAFILAVSLALVGILAAFRPGQVYPFTLEFGSLGLVTYVILGWERDARVRLWLSGLVAGALALRALLILAIHGGLSPYLFAPDAATYEYFGRGIVDHWRGLRELPTEIVGRWQVAHYYVNALFLYLFGNSSLGTVVLNAFLGAWTAVLSFYLGREVLGERVGRWAAMLTAFYPSLALWSVLNIREAPTTLLVTGVVTVAVVSLRRSSGLELFLLMAGVVVLSMYRDYMAFLVTAGCLLGLFAGTRRGNKMRVLVVGSVLVFFATFAFASLGIFERVALENPLQTATLIREDLQRGAGSAFGLGVETLSFGQALRFLPFGLAHLLFAPFPWAVDSALQLFALPEVLIWYSIMPLTLFGLRLAMKRSAPRTVLIGAVLLVVMVSYALVEGNFGTAYRHRAQFMPLIFTFTAAGIVQAQLKRAGRKRIRRRPLPLGRAASRTVSARDDPGPGDGGP